MISANFSKYVRIYVTDILKRKTGRWNSQLTMISSVLEVPEVITSKFDTVQITGNERKLHELNLVLKPFGNATLMLQQERSKVLTRMDKSPVEKILLTYAGRHDFSCENSSDDESPPRKISKLDDGL